MVQSLNSKLNIDVPPWRQFKAAEAEIRHQLSRFPTLGAMVRQAEQATIS